MYISCWTAHPVICYFCCWLLWAADSIYFLLSLRKKLCIFPFPRSPFSLFSLFFSQSFPLCPFLDHPLSPPPFTWFPAWYICLPSPCLPSFPSHHLGFFPTYPFPVTLHFCLLEFFRQFSSRRMQYLAIFLNSSLVAAAVTAIRNSHTAKCKPGLILQLQSWNRIKEYNHRVVWSERDL